MKDFKRCPRCNKLVANNLARCGNCQLNFNKFYSATNTEAKSAFRMGEKERVLYSKTPPCDIDKIKILLMAIFGGWFGLHYFAVGRIKKGIFQAIGLICGIIYCTYNFRVGLPRNYLTYFIICLGFVWVANVITWIADCLAVIFNRFKYPVSLPYNHKGE